MVSPWFCRESCYAAGSCRSIGGNPTAKLRIFPYEFTIIILGVIPAVVPFPFNQQAHYLLISWSVCLGLKLKFIFKLSLKKLLCLMKIKKNLKYHTNGSSCLAKGQIWLNISFHINFYCIVYSL